MASRKRQRREFEESALVHLDAIYRAALRLARDSADAQDLFPGSVPARLPLLPPIRAWNKLPGLAVQDPEERVHQSGALDEPQPGQCLD